MSESATTVTAPAARARQSALVTPEGSTTIADTVVSKIAGIAAHEVSGVHSLGGGTARAIGNLRERIPGARTNHSQGVSVEVDGRLGLADGIRRNVISAVERMTGLHVVEVNVTVNDVHLPQDDAQPAAPQEQRVQ